MTASKTIGATFTQRARPVLLLAEPHVGRVEHEQREPVASRQEIVNCADVISDRRDDLRLPLERQLDRGPVPRRIRCDPSVVEDHPEHQEHLPDGLAPAGLAQARDELRDVCRANRVDAPATDQRDDRPDC
jgi:hypothetical protein